MVSVPEFSFPRPEKPTDLVIFTLVVLTAIGIFYNATSSYFPSGNNATPQPYLPCNTAKNPCTPTALAIFNNSPFQFLATGDLVGFIGSFFTLPQSPISILSIVIGTVMLVLGLGIGFSGSVFATGFSFTPNTQGTRLAQNLGVTFVVFGFVNLLFGAWTGALGFGIGIMVQTLLVMLCVWGAYEGTRSWT